MIERVTLTARHFHGNGKSAAVAHMPDWISNGHWSIQRQYVTNERAINLDDYNDNFKRPRVELFNHTDFRRSGIDYSSALWSAVMFCGVAIPSTMTISELSQELTRPYVVTNWRLDSIEKRTGNALDLRLLCEPPIQEQFDIDQLPAYHCFVDEVYIDAIGLQAGDVLTGQQLTVGDGDSKRDGSTFLVTSDMSRCVMSVANVDSDIEQLPFIVTG